MDQFLLFIVFFTSPVGFILFHRKFGYRDERIEKILERSTLTVVPLIKIILILIGSLLLIISINLDFPAIDTNLFLIGTSMVFSFFFLDGLYNMFLNRTNKAYGVDRDEE